MRERFYSDPRIGQSKNTALEIVTRNRAHFSRGPSVPDLVLLIVLSCPFYGVTPIRLSRFSSPRSVSAKARKLGEVKNAGVAPVLETAFLYLVSRNVPAKSADDA
jgi:hypothetical protein